MRVVIYLRVSSVGQLDGLGLDIQEQACRAYAVKMGWKIVDIIQDGAVSGALPADERPGLTKALNMLVDCAEQEACADVLLAARLDRLARELHIQEAILAQVWKGGNEVHTCDVGEVRRDDPDDPMRTAIRQVMGVFAQLDRAMIAKRLRDGRKRKADLGGHAYGVYPYGWSKVGRHLHEQAVITLMKECRTAGLTLQGVADHLNARGYTTRKGRPWTIRTVYNVVSRNQEATR